MWKCIRCKRNFSKKGQPHSCHSVSLDDHFKNKNNAKELFYFLVKEINSKIGKCQIISIPCCVHLFGKYDFIALLCKKDRLEVRFALDRILDNSRITKTVQMSDKIFKNCLDVKRVSDIDEELIGWIKESYHLKDK